MVDYKIVKYCRNCRVRFIVNRGEAKRIFCDDCQQAIDKENKEIMEVTK